MLELIGRVELCVVASIGLPHFPKDFQPSLSQTPQGRRMALTPRAQLLVIDLGPRTKLAAQIRPEMDGMPEGLVAHEAHINLVDLSGLKTHRSRPHITLQCLCVFK